MNDLIKIQTELVAPKTLRNEFGKYNYRSAEGILDAVKPLLQKYEAMLTLNDDLIQVGERYYVKATARIVLKDGYETAITAFAREEETKKGMDGSQITGASSSYARKYALNGLFLIDDNKDSDATNTHDTPQKNIKPEPPKIDFDEKKVADDLSRITTKPEMSKYWNENKNLQSIPEFKKMITEWSKKLT